MNYLEYLIKHSELVTKAYQPRLPGVTMEAWLREQIKAKEELNNFEEQYPEYTERFNFNKKG